MAKMALMATFRSVSWLYRESVSYTFIRGLLGLMRPMASGTPARMLGAP